LTCPATFSSLTSTCTPRTSSLFPYPTLFRSLGFELHIVAARIFLKVEVIEHLVGERLAFVGHAAELARLFGRAEGRVLAMRDREDRKSTRLNSSHVKISYAVFCLKKKSTIVG